MRVLLRETIFKGRLLTVVRKTVENADGSKWEREVVTYGGSASTIVPFYNGKFVFVKQFRPTIEHFILEFPAGRIEEGETPLECAKRELREETGLIAKNIDFVFSFYPSPGFVDEKMYLFYANQFEKGKTDFDEGEELETILVDKELAFTYLNNGRIIDGKTIIGLLWFEEKYGKSDSCSFI